MKALSDAAQEVVGKVTKSSTAAKLSAKLGEVSHAATGTMAAVATALKAVFHGKTV